MTGVNEMIRQRIGSTAALIVLLFAFVGIGYMLANNPGRLFSQLIFFAIAGIAIFLLFKLLTRSSASGGANSQYKKSVAQSKKLHGNSTRPQPRIDAKKKPAKPAKPQSKVRPIRDRSNAPHLTVIEGKKGKKKKRAF